MNSTIASYVIFRNGNAFHALNGTTGDIYSNSDAATVIQKAYNAAFDAGGGNLFIKKEMYGINSSVELKAFVNIYGEGFGTNLQNLSSGPIFKFVEGYGANVFTTIQNMMFTGGGIGTGPAIQTKDSSLLSYSLTDHITLRDLIIQNMGSYGIYMPSRVEFSTFDNLRVIGNANNGIHATALAANRFSGCNLSENAGDGLYVAWGVGNYYHLFQVADNSKYGMELLEELKSEIHLMYSENNSNKGLYISGAGCQVHMYNTTDDFIIANPAISYTLAEILHPDTIITNQISTNHIRPMTTENDAVFLLQKYMNGNYEPVAQVGNEGFDIYNQRTYSGDYGGNFKNFKLPPAQGIGHFFFAQDMNAEKPAKRIYTSFDGNTWNYANFI